VESPFEIRDLQLFHGVEVTAPVMAEHACGSS
jgi:hypothetical protein